MSYSVTYRPEASEGVEAVYDWYEAERLGLEFVHRPTGLAPLASATADLVGVPVLIRR